MKEWTLGDHILLTVLLVIFVAAILLVIICMAIRLMNSSLPAMMLYSGGSIELASRWHAKWEDRDAKSYHCQVSVGNAEYERVELSNVTMLGGVIPGDYGTIEVTPFDDNETPMRKRRYYIKIPESPFIDRYSVHTMATEDGWIEISFNVSCNLFILGASVSLNNSQPYKFAKNQCVLVEVSKGNWKVRCAHAPFGPLRRGEKITFDITVQNDEGADGIIHSVGVSGVRDYLPPPL